VIHSPALLVLLAVLATARLTVLVNDDYLTERLRAAVDRRAAASSAWDYLSYLLGCPWCVSMWAGLGVAGATYAWHTHWPVQVLLIALAASYLTGWGAELRERLEGEE
jgi:hypothetical protein